MKKILIVEDDPAINKLLALIFKDRPIEVVCAFSGTEGLLQVRTQKFDLILLDLMLPGISGEEFIEKIRKTNQMPILVISAKKELDDKVKLLKMGADDYITKPFDKAEVAARVEVQLRKTLPEKSGSFIEWRRIKIDQEKRQVWVADKKLSLTNAEFDILSLLVKRPEHVFSKGEIYEKIWRGPYYGEDNTISVHISNLRKKILENVPDEYIQTIWGIGYMLV